LANRALSMQVLSPARVSIRPRAAYSTGTGTGSGTGSGTCG